VQTASRDDQDLKYEKPSWKNSVKIKVEDTQKPPKLHSVFIGCKFCGALKSLRHPTAVKPFWVDALCINRSDKKETESSSRDKA